MHSLRRWVFLPLLTAVFVGSVGDAAFAEESAEEKPAPMNSYNEDAYKDVPTINQLQYALDNTFLLLAAVLVLFMQAGFAMLTAGLNATKNTVNILSKNVMDMCVGVLLFFVIGFGIMFPEWRGASISNGWFEGFGFGVSDSSNATESAVYEAGGGKIFPQVYFLFQAAFAATAATIVAGSVAGRMRFGAYLIYSAVLTALIYPLSGLWTWGGGWLAEKGFHDFAGSAVVHAVGGFAGLAGALVLGPRLGRYTEDGKPNPMPGHSITLAVLGTFILVVGWFGFNPGSQVAFSDGANANITMLIATNTLLAACAGGVSALFCSWAVFKKPDLSMALNGILGGLVGITAGCNIVSNGSAILIGIVAGGLLIAGVILLDKFRVDDPVGAWPVHGLCGIWGCLACAIFGEASFGTQLMGSLVISAWAFGTMYALFYGLKVAGILRVSAEDEQRGLDVSEHGMQAYVV